MYRTASTAPSGITAPGRSTSLSIFPNPATDAVWLGTKEGGFQDLSGITVFNAIGRQVPLRAFREGNRVKLDIHDLSPGLYVIIAVDDGNRYVGKLRVE